MRLIRKILSFRFAFFLAITLSLVTFMTVWTWIRSPQEEIKVIQKYNVSMVVPEYNAQSQAQNAVITVTDLSGVPVSGILVQYQRIGSSAPPKQQKTDRQGQIHTDVVMTEYQITIDGIIYNISFK